MPRHDPFGREAAQRAAYCSAVIAPGVRCGHHVQQHIVHGSTLLECWRCDDWHAFVPTAVRRDAA